MNNANSVVILDFETTGLSPNLGDRAIEIGAVKLEKGIVVDQFQALMNPEKMVSTFIESYTGITNKMLNEAIPCAEVMTNFADFIKDDNLVAHNASFDKRFLDQELQYISSTYSGQFACSLLLSRRLYQSAPNHKLATLIDYKGIASKGSYHRALYDAQMTAELWLQMIADIKQLTKLEEVPFSLINKISKLPKAKVQKFLSNLAT